MKISLEAICLGRRWAIACGTILSLVASIAVSSTADAQSTVIYSDTFSRVTGSGDANGDPNGAAGNFSDWGANDNALGGTVAQGWVAGPDRAAGGRNAVTDGNVGFSFGTTSFYDFDATTVSPDGFEVALDFRRYPTTPAAPTGGYIAFGFGVDSGTAIVNDFHAIGASDWSVLFQQAANGNAGNANVSIDNSAVGNFDYGDPLAEHSLVLTVTPQVSGAYGAADLIDIIVDVDGNTQNFQTTGGADFGTFAVSANNFEARFIDNLVVSSISAIPEPSSFALLGLGGLVMLGRRRR